MAGKEEAEEGTVERELWKGFRRTVEGPEDFAAAAAAAGGRKRLDGAGVCRLLIWQPRLTAMETVHYQLLAWLSRSWGSHFQNSLEKTNWGTGVCRGNLTGRGSDELCISSRPTRPSRLHVGWGPGVPGVAAGKAATYPPRLHPGTQARCQAG